MRILFVLLFVPALLRAGEKQLKLFDQVWKQVHDEYYDAKFNGVDWDAARTRYRPEAERASDGEIYKILEKMTAELKDAHTRVIGPREAREDRTRNRVAFGFALRLVEGQYVVTQVEPRSPMAVAGVQKGWVLRSVDSSTASSGAGPREIAAWYSKAAIREKCLASSTVKFDFMDARNVVHPLSAKCTTVNTTTRQEASRLGGGVLYVRLDRFQSSTGAWFTQILESNRDASGMILDLRLNPGGLKSQLLKCLEVLYAKPLSAGVDVSRKGKQHTWKVHGHGARAFTKPLVVLLDELSMSSSEILAAAVEETGRGRVIGRKSPGKVLLSYEIALGGGGRLQLAIRDYRTERGRRLEGAGVVPDEVLPLHVADLRNGVDRDMERALAILNKK